MVAETIPTEMAFPPGLVGTCRSGMGPPRPDEPELHHHSPNPLRVGCYLHWTGRSKDPSSGGSSSRAVVVGFASKELCGTSVGLSTRAMCKLMLDEGHE